MNKLNNVNVDYLKIRKCTAGCTKHPRGPFAGSVFETPGLSGFWKTFGKTLRNRTSPSGCKERLSSWSKALAITVLKVRFYKFPVAQICLYKRFLISSSRKYFHDGPAAKQQKNVVRTLALWNFDRWNEVNAPDRRENTHAKLPWRKGLT